MCVMSRSDKKYQIMRAAEKLFTSRRFHEITTDDIAREAGVGKGTIYRHFADKDDVFRQVAMSGFDEMCRLLETRVAHDGPFERQLFCACEVIVEFFTGRRQLFRMMQTEDGRAPWMTGQIRQIWRQRRERLVMAVALFIEQGVAAGRIRRDMQPQVLANLLLGVLRTRVRDLDDADPSQRDLNVLLAFFLRGAAPDAAPVETHSPHAVEAAK
jgi:AcrR family transcriptional regulator